MSLEVSYQGETIAQLTQSGSLTLQTAGKYCRGDIGLVYTGSGALVGEEAPTAAQGMDGDFYTHIHREYDMVPFGGGYVLREYVVDYKTPAFCKNRFYKLTTDPAIGCVINTITGYYGPILLSDKAGGAAYTDNATETEVIVDGKTWYLAGFKHWDYGTLSPSYPALIPKYYTQIDASNMENDARLILELAGYTPSAVPVETVVQYYDVYRKLNGEWLKLGRMSI